MLAGGLHFHIDGVANAHLGSDRLGRGNAQAKKVDLSYGNDGKAAGLEVPACTREPVSEKRQVTTPS